MASQHVSLSRNLVTARMNPSGVCHAMIFVVKSASRCPRELTEAGSCLVPRIARSYLGPGKWSIIPLLVSPQTQTSSVQHDVFGFILATLVTICSTTSHMHANAARETLQKLEGHFPTQTLMFWAIFNLAQ